MAINETIRDLENYPNKTKTVTLDLIKAVPIDNEGDEVYVLTSSSTNTKVGGGTPNPIFIREYKAGYAKSSGYKTSPFTLTSGNNQLQISIDGSSYSTIVLNSGTGLTGANIAQDMQQKINALAASGAGQQFKLEFLNATVEFVNNRFVVVAGSISNTYTGVGKSSVNVIAATSGDATSALGFDIPVTSEALASKQPTETTVLSNYSGGSSIMLNSTQGFEAGQAFTITDGTNREYLVASGVSASGINLYYPLSNSYAAGAVVQKIFERDPDGDVVASPYQDIDAIVRFSLRSIANQIDFSV